MKPEHDAHENSKQRPNYDNLVNMADHRGPLAEQFASQIMEVTKPYLAKEEHEIAALDIGCGYGHTASALARRCAFVRGIEPTTELFRAAQELLVATGQQNLTFGNCGIEGITEENEYDLVVLDNVFEHLPDQPLALRTVARCLKPGGVAYLLMPNKLWPIEAHYKLPFLSYLHLPLANRYLRWSGRGTDYTDASYAPTYFKLKRLIRAVPALEFHFVLPANMQATMAGNRWHYRFGAALIRRFPILWSISKAFLLVLRKKT